MGKKHEVSTFRFSQEKIGKEKVEIEATGLPAEILAKKTKPQILDTCCSQAAPKTGFGKWGKFFTFVQILAKILRLFDPSQDNYFGDWIWNSNPVPYME